MRHVIKFGPLFCSFALIFAVGVSVASMASESKDSATKTTAQSMNKSSPAIGKAMSKTVAKASAKKVSNVLASAENLSGTISVVDSSAKEVTLVGSNGVPYDFELTKETRIELPNKKIGANELVSENHKQATVYFVPTSRGNLAESIRISAS